MAPNPAETPPRRAIVEVAILYALGLLALLGGEALGALGGFVAENRGAITAAYFLLVPVLVLRRRCIDPAGLGIHGERPGRALLWALLVGAAVFPPYALGFEAWSRLVHGRPLRVSATVLSDFPSEVRDRPDLASAPAGLHTWSEGDRLFLLNTGGAPSRVGIEGCEQPGFDVTWAHGRLAALPADHAVLAGESLDLPPGRGFACPFGEGRLATPGPVLMGAGSVSRDGPFVPVAQTPWWLPELLLIQLVVIALPEEVFYRGYVQTRLAPLFRRRLRFLGADLGPEVVVASALFAASHLVAIPSPFRLAVFFPGLLFGWLRARTGSVLAPAILHALSNVLLEVLVRLHP
jgi:membrane protease YdiL (CAAX protease family)